MAGGRRNAKSGSFKHHSHSSDDRHGCDMPTQPQVIPPKHIPIPEIPTSSDLIFEFEALLLSIFSMVGQYINLFRSVFWLPNSHTEHALNYYLIDYSVMCVNLIMLGRRVPVLLFKKLCGLFMPISYQPTYMVCVHISTLISLGVFLLLCSYLVILENGIMSILFLIYPFVIYIVVLGPNTFNLLELKPLYTQERMPSGKNKHLLNNKFSTPSLSHVCSMSAETIREEVEMMRSDFNNRWKQVLFNSFLVVYCTSFMPCYFAPSTLQYDLKWVSQHGLYTAIGCFTLYTSHSFPPKYCDMLHRAALHLGRWQRVEIKNVHIPYSTWTESAMWNQGALVKHSKELFKAEGISNAAEPGDPCHFRFYTLFKNPSTPIMAIWLLQILMITSQIFIIIQSHAWHDFISLQLLVMVNCKALYGMTRAYFVMKKIYHEEKILTSKFSN